MSKRIFLPTDRSSGLVDAMQFILESEFDQDF
jgi:hypothetical protein